MTVDALGQIDGLRSASSLTPQVATGAENLGQRDFLQLMTAQLRNQDPFQPMENGEFLAQMAQFSTVSGLESVNQTLSEISGQITGGRISAAASMIGQYARVEGTIARPNRDGEIHGSVMLSERAENLLIRFRDGATGAMLHEINLQQQPAGEATFAWTDLPDDIRQSRDAVRLTVIAESNGQEQILTPSVYARISGVEMPTEDNLLNLQVEDYGLRNSLEISALR